MTSQEVTAEQVQRALRAHAVDLSQARPAPDVSSEIKHIRASYAFGWDEGKRPCLIFDVPNGENFIQRILFPFTPEALEMYYTTFTAFIEAERAPAEPDTTEES